MNTVFIIGSTGTLGREALNVINDFKKDYKIIGITGYKNKELLISQAKEESIKYVGISRENYKDVKDLKGKTVFLFEEELHYVLEEAKPDITFFLSNSITSLKGIEKVLQMGKKCALANKESIIAGGEIIFNANNRKYVIPVDSETSAIFQCLQGEDKENIFKVILTASGGPFYDFEEEKINSVTYREALEHPTWRMGSKITVDSSNLVNKAFEVIETHFLFNFPYEMIDVVIHRESIIHSLVEFCDGQIKAVLSPTKMSFPILYALFYPKRMSNNLEKLNLHSVKKLSFEKLDTKKFRSFEIIIEYAKLGGSYLPAIIGADEALVEAFSKGRIKFKDFEKYFDYILKNIKYDKPQTLDDIKLIHDETKRFAEETIRRNI